MSISKTLSSAIAAVTVAGAVGLAYAQSTPDTTQPSAPVNANTSQPASNTTAPADTSGTPSSTTTTTTTSGTTASSGMQTDLEPKADRN